MGKNLIYKKRKHLSSKVYTKREIIFNEKTNLVTKSNSNEWSKKPNKNKKKDTEFTIKTENNETINTI